MLTKHPIWYHTTMADFPVHHSKGNWRPIIKTHTSSVSSSSKNVSPKGATFEEDPCTYSWKASRIVLPTLGDNDAKWSNNFLDRELFVKILHSSWMVPKSQQGWNMPTIQYVQKFARRFWNNAKVSTLQPRNKERLCIFAIPTKKKILVMYSSSLLRIIQ